MSHFSDIQGGLAPIHRAAKDGDANRLRAALAAGVPTEFRSYRTLMGRPCLETPLHLACESGQIEIVGLLLAAGADLKARTAAGRTPLHLAAAQGRNELVAKLVAAGAFLEAEDEAKNTPLHMAVHFRHSQTAELLIRLGAEGTKRAAEIARIDGTLPNFTCLAAKL